MWLKIINGLYKLKISKWRLWRGRIDYWIKLIFFVFIYILNKYQKKLCQVKMKKMMFKMNLLMNIQNIQVNLAVINILNNKVQKNNNHHHHQMKIKKKRMIKNLNKQIIKNLKLIWLIKWMININNLLFLIMWIVDIIFLQIQLMMKKLLNYVYRKLLK